MAKSLPHRIDISRYALRTVADTNATACTYGVRKWWRQEATRATAPTGGGGPVILRTSRPCPLSHWLEAAADKLREPCGD